VTTARRPFKYTQNIYCTRSFEHVCDEMRSILRIDGNLRVNWMRTFRLATSFCVQPCKISELVASDVSKCGD
jgi:hypothetical protein